VPHNLKHAKRTMKIQATFRDVGWPTMMGSPIANATVHGPNQTSLSPRFPHLVRHRGRLVLCRSIRTARTNQMNYPIRGVASATGARRSRHRRHSGRCRCRRLRAPFAKITALLFLLVILAPPRSTLFSTLISVVAHKHKQLPSRLLSMCSASDPIRSGADKKALRWLYDAVGEGSLMLQTSPQHYAACWILYNDRRQSRGRSKGQLLQRFALATLHYATTRSNTTQWQWDMAPEVRNAAKNRGNWLNPKIHECGWYGVACTSGVPLLSSKTVIRLELGFLALDGLLPRDIGLLTQLQELDVHGCDLQGVLPHKMLLGLGRLEYLRLHMNGFFGAIHKEIVGLKSLKQLIGFGNYLGTSVTCVLSSMPKLEIEFERTRASSLLTRR